MIASSLRNELPIQLIAAQDDRLTLGVPVIDPSITALKRAEYADLKRMCGGKPSRRWSCEPPPEAEIAAFGIIGDSNVFGNRLVVGAE